MAPVVARRKQTPTPDPVWSSGVPPDGKLILPAVAGREWAPAAPEPPPTWKEEPVPAVLPDREDSASLWPLPPRSAAEVEILKHQLLAENGSGSLHIWAETGLVLAGSELEELCRELRRPCPVVRVSLPDRTAARLWVLRHLPALRPLAGIQLNYVRGLRYLLERKRSRVPSAQAVSRPKDQAGPEVGRRQPEAGPSPTGLGTAERLALEYGVGPTTIKRDGRLTQQVDAIVANGGAEARQALLGSNCQLRPSDIAWLVEQEPQEQRRLIQYVGTIGWFERCWEDRPRKGKVLLPREPEALARSLISKVGLWEAEECARVLLRVTGEGKEHFLALVARRRGRKADGNITLR